MSLSEKEIKKILFHLLPFLSEEDISLFLKISTYKALEDKQTIIEMGNNSRLAFLIVKGTVRGFFISETGIEKNILLRTDGYLVGDAKKLFYNSPQRYTYEAIQKAHVLLFNYTDLENLAFKNQNILKWLYNVFKEIMTAQNHRIETLITMTAKERYLDLVKRNPKFLEKAYAKHVSNYLGITPVSLSRIIKNINEK